MASFTVVKAEDFAKQENSPSQALRGLTSDLSCLTRQDGSASLSQGDTTSTAVVYGPAEVRINKEQIDQATVEVVYRPKVGLPRPEHRKQERLLRNSLVPAIVTHLHPRSSISIIIQETEDMGSNIACCLNAACLALLDAAVNMNFLVAAVTVAIKEDGEMVLDPNKTLEAAAQAVITFVFDSIKQEVVSVVSTGKISHQRYKESVQLAREASKAVFQFYKESISKKLLMSE